MTTRDNNRDDLDDLPDPLAGIDLRTWQPPAPIDQTDAILHRHAGTRTDVAAAVELDGVRRPPQRMRWLAAGILIGAACAALIAFVASRTDDAAPAPTDVVTHDLPAQPTRPAGAVLSAQESANKRRLAELEAAVRDQQYATAIATFATIPADSIFHARAQLIHDQLRDTYTAGQIEIATILSKRHLCAPLEGYAIEAAKLWPSAAAAMRAVPCVDASAVPLPTGACDAELLLDKARAARAKDRWRDALDLAEASEACVSSSRARSSALTAACHLKDKARARRYATEFAGDEGLRKACFGVVKIEPAPNDLGPNPYATPDPVTPDGLCDAEALLTQAREAGGANAWATMLMKAEASIACKPSKGARQLALMAACRIGNKATVQKYWPEFRNNTGMRQICIGVVDDPEPDAVP